MMSADPGPPLPIADGSYVDRSYIDERAQGFTGRTWVFDEIRAVLAGPASRFVLVGAPGTGKTAIASRWVQSLAAPSRLAPQPEEPGPHEVGTLPAGPLHAVYFCRAGMVDVLDAAQSLSSQLAATVPGFADVLGSFLAGQITVSNVRVQTGAVTAGASVTGVRIDLGALGPERAFVQGVTLALKRLREAGSTVPIVILVDALDEALSSEASRMLPELVSSIHSAHVLVTTRPDRRVLGLFEGNARVVDLVRDAPPQVDDVRDYARHRLLSIRHDAASTRLAQRIAEQARGNFLYAVYVINGLLADSALRSLSPSELAGFPLPEGGLPGVYRDFLRRELARSDEAWAARLFPVLGAIAVARDHGFTTDQLVGIATHLLGHPFTRTQVRQITRSSLSQFIEGERPDGPFRTYHQTFAEFLLDPEQNPDHVIDAAEVHEAIAATYLQRDRGTWDAYGWRHLLAHAFEAGRHSGSFATVFTLAESDYLEQKLTRLFSLALVASDYELLFDACERTSDLGRLARYAMGKVVFSEETVLLESDAFLRLSMRTAEQASHALDEYLGICALFPLPVMRASMLLDVYEACPDALLGDPRITSIPNTTWELLAGAPQSEEQQRALRHLVTAVSRREPPRLAWAESIAAQLPAGGGAITKARSVLAQGYLRAGDERNAVRNLLGAIENILKELRTDTVTWVGDSPDGTDEFFDACLQLKSREAFAEVYEAAAPGIYASPSQALVVFKTRLVALLARAGREAVAARWLAGLAASEPQQAVIPTQRHVFPRLSRSALVVMSALPDQHKGLPPAQKAAITHWTFVIAEAASVLAQFSDPEIIGSLLKQFARIVTDLRAPRIAARLVDTLAAYVRRGLASVPECLMMLHSLDYMELGDHGCRDSLEELIRSFAEAHAEDALLSLARQVPAFESAEDRERLAAVLIGCLVRVGKAEQASKLFIAELTSLSHADDQQRPAGFMALAGAAAVLGEQSLAERLVGEAFESLDRVMDEFPRGRALVNMVDTAAVVMGPPLFRAVLRRAAGEGQRLHRARSSALGGVARAAEVALGVAALPEIVELIRGALLAPSASRASASAAAVMAEAYHLMGKSSEATRSLRLACRLMAEDIDELTKPQSPDDITRACLRLGAPDLLEALLTAVLGFRKPEWTLRLFAEISQRVADSPLMHVLEPHVLDFAASALSQGTSITGLACLGYLARGAAVVGPSETVLEVLRGVEQRLEVASAELAPEGPGMEGSQDASYLLEPQAELSRALIRLGYEEEAVQRLQHAIDHWLPLLDASMASSVDVDALARALVSLTDAAVRDRMAQAMFDSASVSGPGLLYRCIQELAVVLGEDLHVMEPRRLLDLCTRVLRQHRTPIGSDDGSPETGHSASQAPEMATQDRDDYPTERDELMLVECAALAATGGAWSRLVGPGDGTAFLEEGLGLAQQIQDEQLRAWSFVEVISHCPQASPVRGRIESQFLKALGAMADAANRSDLAAAWLKSTRCSDATLLLRLFSDVFDRQMPDVVAHVVGGCESLDRIAPIVLRASAQISKEVLLVTLAHLSRESAARGHAPSSAWVELVDQLLGEIAPLEQSARTRQT